MSPLDRKGPICRVMLIAPWDLGDKVKVQCQPFSAIIIWTNSFPFAIKLPFFSIRQLWPHACTRKQLFIVPFSHKGGHCTFSKMLVYILSYTFFQTHFLPKFTENQPVWWPYSYSSFGDFVYLFRVYLVVKRKNERMCQKKLKRIEIEWKLKLFD